MIDAHCHLNHMLKHVSLEALRSRAILSGVSRIVSCSCSVTDWEAPISEDGFILPQFGVHPWWAAERRPENWLMLLRSKLLDFPFSGVGEIGLDKNKAKRGEVPFPVQIVTFKSQLQIAKELDRTCSINCVNAYGSLIDILRESELTSPLVIHSFSGNGDQIRDLLKYCGDIYFSVSAQCPKTEVIPLIPLERLLLETDSPDQPFRSDPGSVHGVPPKLAVNDCSQLPLVALRVSLATGKSIEDISLKATENTRRAFRIN